MSVEDVPVFTVAPLNMRIWSIQDFKYLSSYISSQPLTLH